MQAIGAHNKVELPLGARLEPHSHMSFLIVDLDYFIAKDRLDVALTSSIAATKDTTTNRHIASARKFEKNAPCRTREIRFPLASTILISRMW